MTWMLPHGNMGGGHHMYLAEGFDTPEEDLKTKGRRRKKLLYKTVCEQMEFYFSDANLSKDRYLHQLLQDDPYVPLETFLKFNKINQLVPTVEDIAKAIKKSDFLELSEDSLRVHRKTAVKVRENEDDCTIYVENLPSDLTHDELKKVFSEFGKVVYVSIPKYYSTGSLKGFAFVEFDTPQDAADTIRIFEEKGSCLSPHMLPEKLCSIRTFDSQNNANESKPLMRKNEEPRSGNEEFSSKSADNEETEENGIKSALEETSGQSAAKKRKFYSEDDLEINSGNEEKKAKNDNTNDRELTNNEKNHVSSEQEKEIVSSGNESNAECKNNETSPDKKKKKNRKKKKQPKERKLFAHGMVVLSKKEWKRLRNKYLNMQRVNMQRVKQQVQEARFMRRQPYMPHPGFEHGRNEEMRPPPPPVDAPKARVTFVPGVIVCVKFNEPVVDVKAFKSEARTQPGVQYVDIHEGAFEAFLRCSGSPEAQHLLQINFWKNMSILDGNEEAEYWEKISSDREAKLGKKVKITKEKGKKKLLRKAEIVKATHLHFES